MDCSFCGRGIRKGLDSIYVTAKGKVFHFCSSKCEKNRLKLGRSRRKTKWTTSYRKEKEARLKLLKEGVKEDIIGEKAEKAETKEAVRYVKMMNLKLMLPTIKLNIR